jgi:UDP-glucose 4-epimerase
MRILVTGGAGFIGSHLSDRLIADGHDVVVLDDLSTGSMNNLSHASTSPNFKFVNGSILSIETLRSVVANVDYIFHLAAAVGVFNIVKDPLTSLFTNIRGTENLLEVASSLGIPVFVTSSSEVYGKNTSDTLKETDDRIVGNPLILRWSYSEAKAIDESLAYAFHLERNLDVRIVRLFNTVGPRQLGSYGMVVPRFVESALSNQDLVVYGDGKQTRCFAHVLDVVDAILLLAFSEKAIGKVVNIGNSFEISINELAKKIIEETKSKSKIVHIPYEDAYGESFEDMSRRVPNIGLIKQITGWVPRYDLSKIIADMHAEMTPPV